MLSRTAALAQCVWCGDRTYLYSPKLSASVCGVTCEKQESDRIFSQLVAAEEVQPEGELQGRKRGDVAKLGNRSFSIS